MPKLLVLFAGTDPGVADVARWVHEGARDVRFAEADLARVPGDAGGDPRVARIAALGGVESLTGYDAMALGGTAADHEAMRDLLECAAPLGLRGALANKLGSVFPGADPAATGDAHPLWPLLAPMARYGMILVPPGYAGPAGVPEGLEEAARRLGRRLVDIAAWITHARSHTH